MTSLPLTSSSKADVLLMLQQAIQHQQVVQFKCDGHWRTVAPYKVGYLEADPYYLVVFGYNQDAVSSPDALPRWQLFPLAQIQQLSVTTYFFEVLASYEEPVGQFDSGLGPLLWLPHGLKQASPARKRTRYPTVDGAPSV